MLVEEIKKYTVLIESVLTEAQNYEDMFNDVKQLISQLPYEKSIEPLNKEISDIINRAKTVLKTSDRIVWFLRLWKIGFILELKHEYGQQDVDSIVNKLTSDLAKRGGYQSLPLQDFISVYKGSTKVLQDLAHYLSLPIPAIQNYVFGFKSLDDILTSFDEYESVWKAQAKELIPYDPNDGEVVLKFPDGYFWQNLNRAYCRAEGNAMGHCGNAASYKSGDEVLSLRQLVKRGDKVYVRPSLTFILDRDGFLGEMKGRANKKPEKKYHPYIIELLKLPSINGIKGGGYAPEQNFSINDLDDHTREELIELKPTLGTLLDIYEKYGRKHKLFISALNNTVNGTRLDYLEIKDRTVVVEEWSNFESFIRDIDDDILNYFNNIYFNNDYEDLLDISEDIDYDDIYDLIDGLRTEQYVSLLKRLGVKPYSPNDTIRYTNSIHDAVELFRKDDDLMGNLIDAVNRVIEKRKETIDEIKEKTLAVIQEYIGIGWSFNVYSGYVSIQNNLEDVVRFEINLDDYVSIVASDPEQDDEFSYEKYQVYDTGWSGVDWYNTEQSRKDAKLPSTYDRKDTSNLAKLIFDDISIFKKLNFKIYSNTFASIANL